MQVKLSVVIITFNEEKNIARCVNSVREIADEVVVVDSFSKDRTEEICRELNVKFVQHAFAGHIEQKNYAITQAAFPHILSLDADEALSPELVAAIKAVKNNWQADGYFLNRLTNYCGQWIKHSGWYPDRKLRLWDSRKGAWGGTNPHDKFIMEPNARVKYLSCDLLHYSFYTITQHVEQVNKFTSIGAQQLFNKGKKPTAYQLFLKPSLKFFLSYVLKRGFLDGFYGYTICKISAMAVYLKYAKVAELFQQEKYK